jgi:hypothetical protein
VTTSAPPEISADTTAERTASELIRAAISAATSAPALRVVSTMAADPIESVPDRPSAPEVGKLARRTWARAISKTSTS